jgi:hypothetical protein
MYDLNTTSGCPSKPLTWSSLTLGTTPMEFTELIKCLGIAEKITLLGYSKIRCVLLLGEDRQSKADCQSCKGK